MKTNRGFTLMEVVVVIAVVSLLAAIIVPMVAKQIDDAKVARAKNECLVIAAAIAQFYKDVGVWPAMVDDGTNHTMDVLVSGTQVDSDCCTQANISSYGYNASTSNPGWYDGDGSGSNDDVVDIFDNHLNENNPDGQSSNTYPSSGEFRWRGPYLKPVGADPWGHWYVCNIEQAYTGTDVSCMVLSAGQDGVFDTAYEPTAGTSVHADDVGAVVHARE